MKKVDIEIKMANKSKKLVKKEIKTRNFISEIQRQKWGKRMKTDKNCFHIQNTTANRARKKNDVCWSVKEKKVRKVIICRQEGTPVKIWIINLREDFEFQLAA